MNPVLEMVEGDRASFAEVSSGGDVALIRYRLPVLGGSEVPGYPWRLAVLWPYAECDSGALPTREANEAMNVFEERLFEALGHDNHAVWVAVLTFDGARQWVFYTSDVSECGRRLAAMPHEERSYPIELEADEDPTWTYLRESILNPLKIEA
ncbi:DUF695 domain-containing protein [Luteolibacter marinus]|uniref:DUF695 domain-containing protein n=1 Tax=Luteolibacter marinus TaxID=2776705 RepID=UPI00186966DB|nr:DUF695 domain-containing protein [Luteolibacter marinus]